jgi:D-arabinose 1-dehydrogenase-like Zn-dependent alcohol dehydrogenase
MSASTFLGLHNRRLEDRAPLKPGDWVGQILGNGAVGQYVVRLAKRAEYKTLSIVRREKAADRARSLGGRPRGCAGRKPRRSRAKTSALASQKRSAVGRLTSCSTAKVVKRLASSLSR